MRLKKVPVWKKTNGVEKIVRYRELSKLDVLHYFHNIRSRRPAMEYCERCGINIGPEFMNKEANHWNTFYLCIDCYEDKVENKKETIPDLEDLERFGIDL